MDCYNRNFLVYFAFMKSIGRFFIAVWAFLKGKTVEIFRGAGRFSARYPFRTFLGTLLIVFVLIFIGNQMRKPKIPEETKPPVKQVRTYALGGVPFVQTQGQVEKSGVITITAQAPGIISALKISEGQTVPAKTQLLWLSSNYQGGNSATVARQIAQAQYINVQNSYNQSKELIELQKQLAEKNKDNTNELRSITEDSLDETRSLLSLNESILGSIDGNVQTLERNNTSGANDALILSTKQLKSQFQGVTNQLRSGLRQSEYQADENKPLKSLSDLQKDVAIKQLDLQLKGLELSREVSGLQVRLAQINEATMYPAAPFAGRIERVHVRIGQTVNPGTPMVTLAGNVGTVRIIARLAKDIAGRISTVEKSTITLPTTDIELSPTFIAQEATDGTLVSVTYDLTGAPAVRPSDISALTDLQYLPISLPVTAAASSSATVFVPLDSVFQTQQSASVFVIDNDKARSRTVELGSVVGTMVEVTSGLSPTDEIILNRTVLDGEQVIRTNETNEPKKKQELG